jgi:hypothetical protein
MTKKSKAADGSATGLKAQLAKTFSSLRGRGKLEAEPDNNTTADTNQQVGNEDKRQPVSTDGTVSVLEPIANLNGRATSKHDQVICLLGRKEGASIEEMVAVTGWQKHTVRGFLSGQVKTKLTLNLVSEKTDRGRIYRVIPDVDLTEAGQ